MPRFYVHISSLITAYFCIPFQSFRQHAVLLDSLVLELWLASDSFHSVGLMSCKGAGSDLHVINRLRHIIRGSTLHCEVWLMKLVIIMMINQGSRIKVYELEWSQFVPPSAELFVHLMYTHPVAKTML